jgi:predicted kinase
MRKWMRERMKRRPKPPEKGKAESPQAPLQPAYFDADVPASSPSREVQESESESPESQSPALQPEERQGRQESKAAQSQPAAGDANRRRRRRRGRGGRGRGGGGAQPSGSSGQTQAGSSLKQNIPTAISAPQVPRVTGTAAGASSAAGVRPKGVVILAIGLPGSGKSSWFKRHNITPLSSDLLRALLFDDATEQRFQDLVFSNLRSMLKARLIARRPTNYVDATNLTPHERQSWIKLAKDYGYEVHAVFFDVPVEVCLERNRRRERVVAEDVMRRMSAKLRPPTFEEGFAKITLVRVKQKD